MWQTSPSVSFGPWIPDEVGLCRNRSPPLCWHQLEKVKGYGTCRPLPRQPGLALTGLLLGWILGQEQLHVASGPSELPPNMVAGSQGQRAENSSSSCNLVFRDVASSCQKRGCPSPSFPTLVPEACWFLWGRKQTPAPGGAPQVSARTWDGKFPFGPVRETPSTPGLRINARYQRCSFWLCSHLDTRLCCACLLIMFDSVWPHGLHSASLSMGFPRQECWSGLPFPSPGDLPDPGIEQASFTSPTLAGSFFTTVHPGKHQTEDRQFFHWFYLYSHFPSAWKMLLLFFFFFTFHQPSMPYCHLSCYLNLNI